MPISDLQLQRLGLKPMAHLSNRKDFQFTGVLRDLSEKPCRVGQWPSGEHYVTGAVFSELIGWKNK